MKPTQTFIGASLEDTFRSGFHGYLHISYKELVDKLGIPHDRTQDGEWKCLDEKVRAEWAFRSTNPKRPCVLTIYDYKEYHRSIQEVNQWHVGLKGDAHFVDILFKEKGLYPEAFEIRKKYR